MKKLGLVGGMGPESTVPYYQGIVYGVQEKLGKNEFPILTIESVDLFKVVDLCKNKKYDELVKYLLDAVNNLVNAGADFVALTANTSHIVYDQLKELCPVKIISIIDSTCNEALRRGYKKIGLMGTVFTMKQHFFKIPFEKNGIKIEIPSEDEISYINDKIYNELEFGIIKEDTRQRFTEIIDRLKKDKGIEAIILGCTELPLILNDNVSPLPCLDTMKIHIADLVNEII